MTYDTRNAGNGNLPDLPRGDDWRTDFLIRRHRIPRAQAVEYLNWAQPRWEPKV